MKLIEAEKANGCFGNEYFNFREISKVVKRKYGDNIIIKELSRAGYFAELLNGLGGKRILDLGCGSLNSLDDSYRKDGDKRKYEPWLPRILHELGAKVVGVDFATNEKEEFEHYQIDLRSSNSLSHFKEKEFDLACAFALFDSTLCINGARLFNNLLPQLERIVKPEGFFVVDVVGTGLQVEMFRSKT